MRPPSNAMPMPMPKPVCTFLHLACQDAWSVLPADALAEADTIALTITVRQTDGSRIVGEKKVPLWEIYSCFGEEEGGERMPSLAAYPPTESLRDDYPY